MKISKGGFGWQDILDLEVEEFMAVLKVGAELEREIAKGQG